jgi:hypothetical protein
VYNVWDVLKGTTGCGTKLRDDLENVANLDVDLEMADATSCEDMIDCGTGCDMNDQWID